MTIITQGDSNGTRRCDSTCHGAKKPACACICGGRYHGKGDEGAREQITQDFLGADWREKKAEAERRGLVFADVVARGFGQLTVQGVGA